MFLSSREAPTPAWGRFQDNVGALLSRRLTVSDPAPLAVAVSGGGDSVALLLAARAWAGAAGRDLVCLTVDHGLNAASAEWTAWCAALAGRLGVAHLALPWRGDKPRTGLPAAARAARHALLAGAAREAGARVILMGHTADDGLEARAMRAEGCRVSSPAEWGPSPTWPDGEGVFLLRPMLSERRAAIRAALIERGEDWLEDPSNNDPRFARSRARRRLAIGEPELEPSAASRSRGEALFRHARVTNPGEIVLPITALTAAPAPDARAFLGAALLCAAGGSKPARGHPLNDLLTRLKAGDAFVATLCGARIECDGDCVRLMRDAGTMTDAVIPLAAGQSTVFDGRIEITAHAEGLSLGGLGGRIAQLEARDRQALRDMTPAARRALPAMLTPGGAVGCPVVTPLPHCSVRVLVAGRLAAACGAVSHEAAIGRVGEMPLGILNADEFEQRPGHEPA